MKKRAARTKTTQSLTEKINKKRDMKNEDIIKLMNEIAHNSYDFKDFMDLCVRSVFGVYDQKEKDWDDLQDVGVFTLLYQIYKDAGGMND